MAHKAEHAVDLDTGAIVGITVQGADEGDTTTIHATLPEAAEQLEAVAAVTDDAVAVIGDVVADKGYHSRTTVHNLETLEIRTYISEPDADGSCGRTKKPNETRSTRIDGASAGIVANGSSADAGNCSSDHVRISTRPVGSGACTCAGARTCLSESSFIPAPSISGCGCGRCSALARRAASRDVRRRSPCCSTSCGRSFTTHGPTVGHNFAIWHDQIVTQSDSSSPDRSRDNRDLYHGLLEQIGLVLSMTSPINTSFSPIPLLIPPV